LPALGKRLFDLFAEFGRARSCLSFRLSMIGSGGDMKVFWSNGLVGSITTLAIVLLFWPVIDRAFGSVARLLRPVKSPV